MNRDTSNFNQLDLLRTIKKEFSDRGVRNLQDTYFSKDGCLKITISEPDRASSEPSGESYAEVIQHNLYDSNYHGGEVLFKGSKTKAKKFFLKQIKLVELMLE
jgi:hypothetical protein